MAKITSTRLQLDIRLRGEIYKVHAVLTLPPIKLPKYHLAAILSHGGGSERDHGGHYDHGGSLPGFATAFAEIGIPCLRYTFNNDNYDTDWFNNRSKYDPTYRLRRDAMNAVLIAVRRQVDCLSHARWIAGGFSWSANAAAELSLKRHDIAALLLIEFDYHRPVFTRFPFEKLKVPAMFIIGTEDDPSLPVLSQLKRIRIPYKLYLSKGTSRRLIVRDDKDNHVKDKTEHARLNAWNAVKHFIKTLM